MEILSSLATLAFVVVGATVGTRLILLSRRTGELPERAVGLALLLIGGVGYPLAVVSGAGVVAPLTGVRLLAVATLILDAGFIAIVVFTWSVFRREQAGARALLAFLCLAYVAHALGIGFQSLSMQSPAELSSGSSPLTLGGQALNSVAFGWTAFEAWRYWWMLHKRAAIGLGDPVVRNRFLLWGMSATASLLTNGLSWWIVYQGIDFFESVGVQAAIGILSVASCTGQYLAFLPPQAYLSRLRSADAGSPETGL